jgi:hypothetical protein
VDAGARISKRLGVPETYFTSCFILENQPRPPPSSPRDQAAGAAGRRLRHRLSAASTTSVYNTKPA